MPSRRLEDCDPELVERYILLAEDFCREHQGMKLTPIQTYRSLDEQRVAYATGRSQLLYGNHNHVDDEGRPCSRAIDVMVSIDDKPTWDTQYYLPLVELATRHGLVSGGSWKTLKDYDHLELREPLTSEQ